MSEDTERPKWQQRVIAEKEDLDEKLGRLRMLINNDNLFSRVPPPERSRLLRQAFVMEEYSAVLGNRIKANFE